MHFSSILLKPIAMVLMASSVMAATQTVTVGKGGTLTFTPSNITAAVGDVIQFQFVSAAHSISQSSFAAPCTVSGIDSGFKTGNSANPPTFSITVNDTQPFWGFCAEVGHCQAGMVFSINADESSDMSYEAFKLAASTAISGAPPSNAGGASSSSATRPSSSQGASSSAAVGGAYPSGGASKPAFASVSAFVGLLVVASFEMLF